MIFDVWKQIADNQLEPLYLVYGEESFLIKETVSFILNRALQNGSDEFQHARYDLREIPVEEAVEDCLTVPFFGERKVVVFENPFFLTAENEKAKVQHDLEKLSEYVKNPNPSSVAVFLAPYKKLDERKKLTKLLLKSSVVVHAKPLTEKEMEKWIKLQVKAGGKRISGRGILALLHYVGPNLQLLKNEIEKLLLYGEENITEETVEKTVSFQSEQNVFLLADKVVKRDLPGALSVYDQLIKQNEEPIKILAALASQFRFLFQVKVLLKKGYSQSQLASMLKAHRFRVKMAAEQEKYFSEEDLLRILDQLSELDYRMKSSSANREQMLELFFIKNL